MRMRMAECQIQISFLYTVYTYVIYEFLQCFIASIVAVTSDFKLVWTIYVIPNDCLCKLNANMLSAYCNKYYTMGCNHISIQTVTYINYTVYKLIVPLAPNYLL